MAEMLTEKYLDPRQGEHILKKVYEGKINPIDQQ